MTMTGEEIRTRGLAALRRELGLAGVARFLQQFQAGSGNYARDRGKVLDDLTIGDLKERVRSAAPKSRRRRSGK